MIKKKGIGVILFWLIIWQTVYIVIGSDVLFASPYNTVCEIIKLILSSEFYKIIFCSFFRIAIGFFAGTAVGIILGIITGVNQTAYDLFKPAVNVIKAAPVASFIILALAWLKSGEVPVFISFLTVIPIIWANITEGIRNIDAKLLEMAQVYNFTREMKLKKIYIPSLKPYMRSAVSTGAGFAFKSGIAAEVIGSPAFSIGRKLYESKIYLETSQLFAWTAIIIVLSIIFEKVLGRLTGR